MRTRGLWGRQWGIPWGSLPPVRCSLWVTRRKEAIHGCSREVMVHTWTGAICLSLLFLALHCSARLWSPILFFIFFFVLVCSALLCFVSFSSVILSVSFLFRVLLSGLFCSYSAFFQFADFLRNTMSLFHFYFFTSHGSSFLLSPALFSFGLFSFSSLIYSILFRSPASLKRCSSSRQWL